jgi:hypothetical protein
VIWIGASVLVVLIVVVVVGAMLRRRRTASAIAPASQVGDRLPEVHALDDALRTVESLTDAKGSLLLDQVDRDGHTIRDRLASGEAHLASLRDPDDTGPLLGRVLDEVVPPNPAPPSAPGP